jgi:hypothetical protein
LIIVQNELGVAKAFYFCFFGAFGSLFPLMAVFFKVLYNALNIDKQTKNKTTFSVETKLWSTAVSSCQIVSVSWQH